MSTFYCVECKKEESRSDLEEEHTLWDRTRFHGVCGKCVDKESSSRDEKHSQAEKIEDLEQENESLRSSGESLRVTNISLHKRVRALEAQIENMTELS